MATHRMHLKGPWKFEWLTEHSESSVPKTGRVKMPVDWVTAFGMTTGSVRFRRRFHKPTNLDPDETVWIVLDGVGGAGPVSVNGTILGVVHSAEEPQKFDMTPLLQQASELIIELEFHPSAENSNLGGLFAPVAIEIVGPSTVEHNPAGNAKR
jgi:hypothetical protein